MQAANANGTETGATDDFVTVYVGETLFGLAIERVHDVFVPSGVTPVPLAPAEIVGLLNLRGRVVTAMSLRRRLGLPDAEPEADGKASPKMAIGLEQGRRDLRPRGRRRRRGAQARRRQPRGGADQPGSALPANSPPASTVSTGASW